MQGVAIGGSPILVEEIEGEPAVILPSKVEYGTWIRCRRHRSDHLATITTSTQDEFEIKPDRLSILPDVSRCRVLGELRLEDPAQEETGVVSRIREPPAV